MGSRGSTPSSFAVPGISCASPSAPTGLTASGLKLLSARTRLRNNSGGMPWRCAACTAAARMGSPSTALAMAGGSGPGAGGGALVGPTFGSSAVSAGDCTRCGVNCCGACGPGEVKAFGSMPGGGGRFGAMAGPGRFGGVSCWVIAPMRPGGVGIAASGRPGGPGGGSAVVSIGPGGGTAGAVFGPGVVGSVPCIIMASRMAWNCLLASSRPAFSILSALRSLILPNSACPMEPMPSPRLRGTPDVDCASSASAMARRR